MKLCQKCRGEIRLIIEGPPLYEVVIGDHIGDSNITLVPEPDCEFYLHKELNRWKTLTERELGGMPKW